MHRSRCAGMFRRSTLVTLLAPFCFASAAQASADWTAAQIKECMDANRPAESSEVDVVFRSRDRSDMVTNLVAKMYWKDMDGDANVLLRLSAPPKYRGAAVLILEKGDKKSQLFMYLPELGRVKRISGSMMSGSVFGTDFTYEEFERLQGYTKGHSTKRLDDSEVDGTPVYVLEHVPEVADDSEYERTVEYIETAHCVALKTDFYGRGERLEKTLTTAPEAIKPIGDKWISYEMKISDLLDRTETTLQVEEAEFDGKVPRKLFSVKELDRGGR